MTEVPFNVTGRVTPFHNRHMIRALALYNTLSIEAIFNKWDSFIGVGVERLEARSQWTLSYVVNRDSGLR